MNNSQRNIQNLQTVDSQPNYLTNKNLNSREKASVLNQEIPASYNMNNNRSIDEKLFQNGFNDSQNNSPTNQNYLFNSVENINPQKSQSPLRVPSKFEREIRVNYDDLPNT